MELVRLDRSTVDFAIQTSLSDTLSSLGEDCLRSVLTLLGEGQEVPATSIVSRLSEVDKVLDELFAKFSKIIKHVTILEACSKLKVDPPTLGNSLFWMVEEIQSTLWKAQP